MKMQLPAHELLPEIIESLRTEWLGKDICKLLCSINGLNNNGAISNKTSKVMILDGNVFCSWSELLGDCHSYAGLIILMDFTHKVWLCYFYRKDRMKFFHESH